MVPLFSYWVTRLFNKYSLRASYVLDTPLDTRLFAVNKKDKNSRPHASYSAGWTGVRGTDEHPTSLREVQCTHCMQTGDKSDGTGIVQ